MRLSPWLTGGVVAVHAPRLVLQLLDVDRHAAASAPRQMAVMCSAIAMVAVLSAGTAYLAHRQAESGAPRWLRAAWVLTVLLEGALLAPSLVAGLRGADLGQVLSSPALQWAWAVVLVAALSLVVGASVIADQKAHEISVPLPDSSSPPPVSDKTYVCVCGYARPTQQAMAGHQRKCSKHLASKGMSS
jgi:hypothetical protein